MRIAKSILVNPERNSVYGTTAVALSLFVFAYSSRFGQISILAYYAMWLPLIFVDYHKVLGNYARYGWILAFAVFSFLSAFWSEAPAVSLRAAVQYFTHAICALIAMRVLATETLARGSVAGCTVVLLFSLAFGNYHYDPLDGTYSFVGAFSSKNQLGLYASLGVLFSYMTATVFRGRILWTVASLLSGMLSAYALFASQSATSIITTTAVLCVCIAMQISLFLAPRNRQALFVVGLVVIACIGIAAVQLGAMDAVLGAFGKDTTLTGRTYLWQQGILEAGRAPWLGIGYYGFWVQGFPEAERLWDDFFIVSRSGFHFHNTYIETMVETGIAGTFLISAILLFCMGGHIRLFLRTGRSPQSLLLFAISALLFVRSFVEIDIMHPYHIGSFLLYFIAGKVLTRERDTVRPRTYHVFNSKNAARWIREMRHVHSR